MSADGRAQLLVRDGVRLGENRPRCDRLHRRMQPDAQSQEKHRKVSRQPFDRLLCLVDGSGPPHAGLQAHQYVAHQQGRCRGKLRARSRRRRDDFSGRLHCESGRLPQSKRFDGDGLDPLYRTSRRRHALSGAREISVVRKANSATLCRSPARSPTISASAKRSRRAAWTATTTLPACRSKAEWENNTIFAT